MLTIKFFAVGCADAILISYLGNDAQTHHIVIDSGEAKHSSLLKSELEKCPSIDLLVITHIDNDHIGGLSKLIEEGGLAQKGFIKNCWFNALSKIKNSPNTEGVVGIKQGKLVRDTLSEQLGIELPFITNKTQLLNLFGAKLTVVSPDEDSLKKMLSKWQTKEPIGAKQYDYNKTIEELVHQAPPSFDTSEVNRSSIAFLFEYKDFKMLA